MIFEIFLFWPFCVYLAIPLSFYKHLHWIVPIFLFLTLCFLYALDPRKLNTCEYTSAPPAHALIFPLSPLLTYTSDFPSKDQGSWLVLPDVAPETLSSNETSFPTKVHSVLFGYLSLVFTFLFPPSPISTTSWYFLDEMIQKIQLLIFMCLYLLGHVCFIVICTVCDMICMICNKYDIHTSGTCMKYCDNPAIEDKPGHQSINYSVK